MAISCTNYATNTNLIGCIAGARLLVVRIMQPIHLYDKKLRRTRSFHSHSSNDCDNQSCRERGRLRETHLVLDALVLNAKGFCWPVLLFQATASKQSKGGFYASLMFDLR